MSPPPLTWPSSRPPASRGCTPASEGTGRSLSGPGHGWGMCPRVGGSCRDSTIPGTENWGCLGPPRCGGRGAGRWAGPCLIEGPLGPQHGRPALPSKGAAPRAAWNPSPLPSPHPLAPRLQGCLGKGSSSQPPGAQGAAGRCQGRSWEAPGRFPPRISSDSPRAGAHAHTSGGLQRGPWPEEPECEPHSPHPPARKHIP